jgi:hypothetical protein
MYCNSGQELVLAWHIRLSYMMDLYCLSSYLSFLRLIFCWSSSFSLVLVCCQPSWCFGILSQKAGNSQGHQAGKFAPWYWGWFFCLRFLHLCYCSFFNLSLCVAVFRYAMEFDVLSCAFFLPFIYVSMESDNIIAASYACPSAHGWIK